MSFPSTTFTTVLIYGGHKLPHGGFKGPYSHTPKRDFSLFTQLNALVGNRWAVESCFGGRALEKRVEKCILSRTLLVIPAGPASDLDEAFSEKEIIWLKNQVKEGLSLYTTCGSTYWICGRRKWYSQEKEGKVGLLAATAFGPLMPYKQNLFLYGIIALKIGLRSITVLLGGGGKIVGKNITALATFPDESIAFATSEVGKGRVYANMAHIGWGSKDIQPWFKCYFPERGPWEQISQGLSSEKDRLTALIQILCY